MDRNPNHAVVDLPLALAVVGCVGIVSVDGAASHPRYSICKGVLPHFSTLQQVGTLGERVAVRSLQTVQR